MIVGSIVDMQYFSFYLLTRYLSVDFKVGFYIKKEIRAYSEYFTS